MGTMSASDAAPLPRAGEVFFDVRGESRTMRVSWYGDTGVAVFSIWNGGTCTGTFRLPIPELPRMIDALSSGPDGANLPPAGHAAQQAPPDAVDPGPPTAAMQLAGQGPGGPDYPDGPGYTGAPPGHPDARPGYPGDQWAYQDQAGYGQPAAGYQDGYTGAAQGSGVAQGYEDGYADFPQGYEDFPPEYADAGPGYDAPAPRSAGGRHGYGAAPAEAYQAPDQRYQAPADGPYAGDGGQAAGYETEAEPAYPGPGIDELGADPLEADYGGEAEQGFLPGPPTETFSPVAVGGSHSRQAGRAAGPGPAGSGPAGHGQADGYRPPPEDPQDAEGYPGYARPGDSASESLAYHPGRAGRREREYPPSRDRH